MRLLIILSLILLFNGCSSLRNNESEISNHIANLKQVISNPIFNKNSTITINETGRCKFEILSEWSREVSERKGFKSVKTSIEIDFSNNYKSSRFISAHDETEDGKTIQRWTGLVKINLYKEVEVSKITSTSKNASVKLSNYDTDYLSIGVSEPDNMDQITFLLNALDSIANSCKSL